MGYETTCRVRVSDAGGTVREAVDAKVLLETDDLIVRGDARVKIPRASITRVTARAGVVTVTSPAATVSLTLGAEAALKWRKKLEETPKKLIDKLDVKPNANVWLIGNHDETLIRQVEDRTSRVSHGRSARDQDVVFVAVEAAKDLDEIERAMNAITDSGAIWVIHRKGPSDVADTTIFGRATALGLTYVKVARVSDTHTAEKLVKPLSARGPAGKTASRKTK